jgi:hypothetical protein
LLSRQPGAVRKKQMPFLAVSTRLVARAVKAAQCAFMGAKRTALIEEAGELGAGFSEEGQGRFSCVWNRADADSHCEMAGGFSPCCREIFF